MGISVQRDNGFAGVAVVLGFASLVPVYGIAAAPFAILFGLLGHQRLGLALGLLGSLENALIVLLFL